MSNGLEASKFVGSILLQVILKTVKIVTIDTLSFNSYSGLDLKGGGGSPEALFNGRDGTLYFLVL